jgi:hypothetical protein
MGFIVMVLGFFALGVLALILLGILGATFVMGLFGLDPTGKKYEDDDLPEETYGGTDYSQDPNKRY